MRGVVESGDWGDRQKATLGGVVAIGASASSVEALSSLAAGLSPDLPYAYLMVLHVPADTPRIINRDGSLPAVTAEHDAPFLHQPRHPTTGRAIGLHLSGLQWVAGPLRRGSFSLPRRQRLDARRIAGRPGRRSRGRAVGTQLAGKGKIGNAIGRPRRSPPSLSEVHQPNIPSRNVLRPRNSPVA